MGAGFMIKTGRIKFLCLLLLLSCYFVLPVSGHAGEGRFPHLEAINLVVKTQFATIRKIDKGDWWFDTLKREWSVRRPFGPGSIDSRHLFIVTYKIDEKEMISWQVDIRKRTVEEQR